MFPPSLKINNGLHRAFKVGTPDYNPASCRPASQCDCFSRSVFLEAWAFRAQGCLRRSERGSPCGQQKGTHVFLYVVMSVVRFSPSSIYSCLWQRWKTHARALLCGCLYSVRVRMKRCVTEALFFASVTPVWASQLQFFCLTRIQSDTLTLLHRLTN